MGTQRSAMGKPVDMSALVARNEKVRAVGNMNVNARGDVIDNANNIIQDNTKRVKNTYNKTTAPQQRRAPNKEVAMPFHEMTSEEREFEDNDEDFKK